MLGAFLSLYVHGTYLSFASLSETVQRADTCRARYHLCTTQQNLTTNENETKNARMHG